VVAKVVPVTTLSTASRGFRSWSPAQAPLELSATVDVLAESLRPMPGQGHVDTAQTRAWERARSLFPFAIHIPGCGTLTVRQQGPALCTIGPRRFLSSIKGDPNGTALV
jgi:hypothetical protein